MMIPKYKVSHYPEHTMFIMIIPRPITMQQMKKPPPIAGLATAENSSYNLRENILGESRK